MADSWKCSCGVTVRRALAQGDEDPEREGDVVELDGVVHSCDTEDDDDF